MQIFCDHPASENGVQLIITGSEPYLLTVGKGFLSENIRVVIKEVIVVMMPVGLCEIIPPLAVAYRCRLLAQIGAGLIQRYGIK